MNNSRLRSSSPRLISPSKVSTGQSGNTNLYFCHYKNAMYMGGVKSFKKDGRGILIHDNGISALSSYYNDTLHGHNIFFTSNSLLSAEYHKNKLTEAVYRSDGYLLYAKFSPEGMLEDKSILINYLTQSIMYFTHKKGVMLTKEVEVDVTVTNRVFAMNEVEFLVGKQHAKTLKYEIDKIPHIGCQKYGNKFTIGFQKGGLMNGLGFSLVFKGSHGGYNPNTHRVEDDFELKIVERGYFDNSQLNGFGEKIFKNGNLYVGEFNNGVFDGHGILQNSLKCNWVSGYFEKGNLVDLLDYNNEGENKKYNHIIESLHERKKNWINHDINVPNLTEFDLKIEKLLNTFPSAQAKTLEERKREVLRKIQENFLSEENNLPIHELTENSSLKKFVRHFIPEIELSPKAKAEINESFENKKMTSSRKSQKRTIIFDKNASSKSIDSVLRTTEKVQKKIREPFKLFNESPKRKEEPSLQLNDNSTILDSKRLLGKSKIFKYVETPKNEITPKFSYTQVEMNKINSQGFKKSETVE